MSDYKDEKCSTVDNRDENSPLTPEEKRLVRRIDLRIIPYLAPLYLLFNLDRANIAYARLYGIEKALNMTPDQYSLTLTIFHIGYILFEVPSNLLLKMVSPPVWIGFIIVTCGISTLCMAATSNFAGVMAVRFFLGLFEAGFFPGVIYLMGMWYTRSEQGFRIALVSSASTFSGAIAGPLSYGISMLDGVRGLASWQWIFIVEGLPTVILGIFAWWIIPGAPATSRWLSEDERTILIRRLKRAHVEIDGKKFDKKQFMEALKDYKTYMYILLFLGFIIPTSSISQLMPTIVKDLGFSNQATMLLTAPPYICALVLKMVMAWNSDRTMQRSYHIIASVLVSISGFVMQAAATSTIPRYVGINLAFAGAIASLPIALSWSNNNMVGATKAPTVIALIIMMGSIGGIVGSQLYKPYESPQYIPSNLSNIGFLTFALFMAVLLRYCLKRENDHMDNNALNLSESKSILSTYSHDFRFVL